MAPDPMPEQERLALAFLFGLSYRMTGDPNDAEDVVQETFLRAMEKPPAERGSSVRPWLARVALNLSRDLLRRRRRRRYVGPWLPGLLAGESETEVPAHEPEAFGISTEGRYDLLESVSIAFLHALEALTPTQRAVLLLRDVFDYSVRATADALDTSEPNVKTTLHRARKAMQGYERDRPVSLADVRGRTREALAAFLDRLVAGDAEGTAALLADDAIAVNDGGGEFHAARNVVRGRDRVARLHLGLVGRLRGDVGIQLREINGLPALVVEFGTASPGYAPRSVVAVRVDDSGRIIGIYTVLASAKLARVAAEPDATRLSFG